MVEGTGNMQNQTYTVQTEIGGPLIFWISFLVFGVLVALVISPILGPADPAKNLLSAISNWILYLPGSLILPLIVSIWIGEGVGKRRVDVGKTAKIGEINAIYTALIYVVAIIIIYLLFFYIDPTAALVSSNLTSFIEYVVVVPVIILVILIPIVSALSAARHSMG